MNTILKNTFLLVSALSMSITTNSSTNVAKSDYRIKSRIITRQEAKKRGYNRYFAGDYWIFTGLYFEENDYYLASITSKVVENCTVTVATYADPIADVTSKERKNVAYTIGTNNIGLEYSVDENSAINASLSSSITATVGVEVDCLITEISASVSTGIGAYINSSLGTGTSTSYSVSYSFDTITKSDKERNLMYSLYEEKCDYHFIDVIIIENKNTNENLIVYLYTEYLGITNYSCERVED